ncbi:hypothetical protein [Zoogloea sp.]|uniref:hypothetical protein n=1 Tax=Zoogloea sp. TaxID=49181 RepID=UPI002608DAD0|nr:hypothetical protein [Zoogloea sp.]MDD3353631.1 hypothetical protein [Zoogloea sp.]
MHLTFGSSAAHDRTRQPVDPAKPAAMAARHGWKRFPYGDRIYRYVGSALQTNWARLHRGDREPYPSAGALELLLEANPALAVSVADPAMQVPVLEDAWRAYHAGDFAAALELGLAAGPVGLVVAARAAVVYASHLEPDPNRRITILSDVVASCSALVQLAPNWPAAWYAHGLALGRYSQNISVLRALALGLGGKVRSSLNRVLELDPDHGDAHVALGVYHAEVIHKVGAAMAALAYGARREALTAHFERACGLLPQSPVVRAEYARAVLLVWGSPQLSRVHELFREAAACQPCDALERLDVEWARSEIE